MLQLNELKVIGRITHDLELGQGKAPYLRFQVAVPRPYRKDADPESDFINAAAFYSTAEYIDTYFGKGAPIYLNGSLRSEDYEDADGNPRRSFTLMVNEAKFVLTKKESEALAAYNSDGGSGGHEDTGNRGGGRSNRNVNNGGGSGGRNTSNRNANSGQGGRQNRRDNQPDGDGNDQGGGDSRSAGSGRAKAGNRSQGSGRPDSGNRSGRNGRSGAGSRQPDRNIPFDPDDDQDLPF